MTVNRRILTLSPMKYVIIGSPSFNPSLEERVEGMETISEVVSAVGTALMSTPWIPSPFFTIPVR